MKHWNQSGGFESEYSSRLSQLEAAEALTKVLAAAFPSNYVRDGYVGTMAQVLVKYPRKVALRCVDPIDGIARECKFLPTVAEYTNWLERESQFLRRISDRESRIAAQLAEREYLEHEGREGDNADPEYRKRVAEKFKAALRAKGMKFDGELSKDDSVAARDHLKTAYDVTDEQIDALPSLPSSWQRAR